MGGQKIIDGLNEAIANAKLAADVALLDPDNLLLGLAAQITEYYGPRCTDFDASCATCQMWGALNVISRGLEAAGAFKASP